MGAAGQGPTAAGPRAVVGAHVRPLSPAPPAPRAFTTLCYSADGESILAGGMSKFVCIYHVKEQVLRKRFAISCNLSLDAMEVRVRHGLAPWASRDPRHGSVSRHELWVFLGEASSAFSEDMGPGRALQVGTCVSADTPVCTPLALRRLCGKSELCSGSGDSGPAAPGPGGGSAVKRACRRLLSGSVFPARAPGRAGLSSGAHAHKQGWGHAPLTSDSETSGLLVF